MAVEIPFEIAIMCSTVTSAQLQHLSDVYHLPPGDGAEIPARGVHIFAPALGNIGFYTEYFPVVLHFPPTTFFGQVISHYKTHLAQFKPNAISKLVCFELLCHGSNVDPTVDVFRLFFRYSSSRWLVYFSCPWEKVVEGISGY